MDNRLPTPRINIDNLPTNADRGRGHKTFQSPGRLIAPRFSKQLRRRTLKVPLDFAAATFLQLEDLQRYNVAHAGKALDKRNTLNGAVVPLIMSASGLVQHVPVQFARGEVPQHFQLQTSPFLLWSSANDAVHIALLPRTLR